MTEMQSQVIETLNRAFQADPAAIRGLLCARVACNLSLANDATIVVDRVLNLSGDHFEATMLGLINGILADCGEGLVAAMHERQVDGSNVLVGFCAYTG